MKSKIKIEEIIGIFIGGIFYYVWAFVILIAGFGNIKYVSDWAIAGMLPFFLIVGHYLIAGNVIEKNKKIDDEVSIKSLLAGFFLWLIVSIILSITKTETNFYVVLVGGYSIMLVIYFYLRSKIVEYEKYRNFTATYAALCLGILWCLYNLLIVN
jgi:hypothetical protein